MNAPRRPAELLAIVGAKLARLPRRVVFIGGATTELMISDPAAPEVSATADVDVIVQAESYVEYMSDVRSELLALGAHEDTSDDAPLCRWVIDGVPVDVMAPSDKVLGFTNRWYAAVIEQGEERELPDGTVILVAPAALFLATKVEAFRGRGAGDYWASKDMEDIVAVLDGRPEVVDEIAAADEELRTFLGDAFKGWLADSDFRDAVSGHLPGDAESQARAELILERIQAMVRTARDELP